MRCTANEEAAVRRQQDAASSGVRTETGLRYSATLLLYRTPNNNNKNNNKNSIKIAKIIITLLGV